MKTRRLTRILLAAVVLVVGAGTSALALDLHIGDGSNWHFLGGEWTEAGSPLVIRPPDMPDLHSRAFYKVKSYANPTVEFDFKGEHRESGAGLCGLILRASDANHFYLVYFPWNPQSMRAKGFWAAIAKLDGDGYVRNIKMAWVRGVPAETDRWYHVKVMASGTSISVTVDGRSALSVTDSTYSSGCVGLAGYGWYGFRNVTVTGSDTTPVWDTTTGGIPGHSVSLGLDTDIKPTGCKAPNGDILIGAGDKMVRSTDGGYTWGDPVTQPAYLGTLSDDASTMFCTAGGTLMVMHYIPLDPKPTILICTSSDNGVTWTPTVSTVADPWPDLPRPLYASGPLVETTDGALTRFVHGDAGEGSRYTNDATWGRTHSKAYAIRSTNGGGTWSAPIEIDQPYWYRNPRGTIVGSLDLMEVTGVAIGNTVTAVVSPIYSTRMWQCWSDDAGASWDACARTTFPGQAQSIVKLSSGPILCAHQYPGYSLNVSHDYGLNWDAGTIIDYSVQGKGCIVATGPSTALFVYTGADGSLIGQIVEIGESSGSAPSSGVLLGQVELEDFVPGRAPVAVGVELIQNSVVVRSDAVTLDQSGNYTLPGVKPGTYDVRFKAASWLAKLVFGKVVTTGNATLCNVSLTNGDVDGDNEVTSTDLSVILKGGQ